MSTELSLEQVAGLLAPNGAAPGSPLHSLLNGLEPKQLETEFVDEALVDALELAADPTDILCIVRLTQKRNDAAVLCSDGFGVTQIDLTDTGNLRLIEAAPLTDLILQMRQEIGPAPPDREAALLFDNDAFLLLGLLAAAGVCPVGAGYAPPRSEVARWLGRRMGTVDVESALDECLQEGRVVGSDDGLAFPEELAPYYQALVPGQRLEIHRIESAQTGRVGPPPGMSAIFVGPPGQRWWIYPASDTEVLIVRMGDAGLGAILDYVLGFIDGPELFAAALEHWEEAARP